MPGKWNLLRPSWNLNSNSVFRIFFKQIKMEITKILGLWFWLHWTLCKGGIWYKLYVNLRTLCCGTENCLFSNYVLFCGHQLTDPNHRNIQTIPGKMVVNWWSDLYPINASCKWRLLVLELKFAIKKRSFATVLFTLSHLFLDALKIYPIYSKMLHFICPSHISAQMLVLIELEVWYCEVHWNWLEYFDE